MIAEIRQKIRWLNQIRPPTVALFTSLLVRAILPILFEVTSPKANEFPISWNLPVSRLDVRDSHRYLCNPSKHPGATPQHSNPFPRPLNRRCCSSQNGISPAMTDSRPTIQACSSRIAIGALSALALHYTIYFAGSVATGMWERQYGGPLIYGSSPLWVLLWGAALVALLWKGKPRLLECTLPFTFWVAYWFVGMVATNFHPDSAEESEVAAFCLAMFLTCFGFWGLTLLLALVHAAFTRFRR